MKLSLCLILLSLAGCQWIPTLNFHSAGPGVRIVERLDGKLLRYAQIDCRQYADSIDIITYAALGESRTARQRVTFARLDVPSTPLCERLIDAPPKTGCACTGAFCLAYEGEQLCQPEAWRWLVEQTVWSREGMDAAFQASLKQGNHHRSFQLRWPTPDHLVADGFAFDLRWSVQSGAEAVQCRRLDPDRTRRQEEVTSIPLVDDGRAGCAFDGARLLINPGLRARADRIEVRGTALLLFPDCPLGHPPEGCTSEDTFVFRTHADRPDAPEQSTPAQP